MSNQSNVPNPLSKLIGGDDKIDMSVKDGERTMNSRATKPESDILSLRNVELDLVSNLGGHPLRADEWLKKINGIKNGGDSKMNDDGREDCFNLLYPEPNAKTQYK